MKPILILLCIFLWYSPLQANFFTNTFDDMKETWHSPQKDLYIPFLTWHSRLSYDRDKIREYNEMPWGAGFGKSRFTEKNWNGIYGMVFLESHGGPKPIIGYGWEHIWKPIEGSENFRTGLGYTVAITTRENWSWIPAPIILPIASIGYRAFTIQGTYIPLLGRNSGNVLFFWLRVQLPNID
ncbi:MAG: lipid IV(A) palmitoyltransferase PagP [Alphaproteobacteria bacterium]|jgi:palmitoyl transferase|nr:lipid IV(A) palmitoyltransferase PagP [Alphaproteobacteria bacterium]